MTTDANPQETSSDRRFRIAQRLRTASEIARVFAEKHTAASDALVVHLSDNGLAWSRLGVITSRRVGNAVRRNAVRRRIREAFRRNKDTLPKGFDIICVALAPSADGGGRLRSSLIELARRASVGG